MSWFKNLSLNLKLVFALLISSLVIIVVSILLVSSSFDQLALATGQQELEAESTFLEARIDELATNLLFAANQLSNEDDLIEAVLTNDKQQLETFIVTTIGLTNATEVDIVNAEGESLLGEEEDEGVSESESEIVSLALLGSEFVRVAYEDEEAEESPLRLTAAVPIRTKNAELIGAILLGQEMDDDFLELVNFGRQSDHLMLSYEGEAVALTNPEGGEYDISTISGLLNPTELSQAQRGNLYIDEQITYTSNGYPQIYAHMPIDIGGHVNDMLTVVIDLQDSFAARNSIVEALTSSLIVLIVIMTAFLLFIFRQGIIAPLNKISVGVRDIMDGNYQNQILGLSHDEIGQLGMAFNSMAQAVQSRETELNELNQSLEQRVEERTTEIRELQQQTQTIIDNLPNSAVFLLDRDYRVLLADGPELAGAGMSEQMVGEIVTDFLDDDAAHYVTNLYESVFDGETQETELDIDGEIYATTYIPLPDEGGQVNTLLGMFTNITERRKADQAIRESEERFRQLAESIDEMFFLLSLDAQETYYMSPNYETIYGHPTESAYDNPSQWIEMVYPEDMPIVQAGFEKIGSGENHIGEFRIIHPSGDIKWIESRNSLVYGDDGQPRAVAGVVTDITARKQAEIERDGLIKDLRAAKRIAEENSRLKSEFLSMMSHELRTPMNAIEGFTSIILNRMAGTDYNPKTERYLGKIQANSKRLLGLINDFLDLSRIESGRLELAYLPMSPETMAQNWKDNLSSLAEKKGLEFEVLVDPNLPTTMYGDEESLSKIAINLLGNAIKFTDEGSVSLALARQNGHMVMEVHDTGMGIPPHAREYIFDEFRQVDMSSKRQHGGTGLGLSIVQKLANAMGGTVTLQSEIGEGSTFTVTVPIHTEALPV